MEQRKYIRILLSQRSNFDNDVTQMADPQACMPEYLRGELANHLTQLLVSVFFVYLSCLRYIREKMASECLFPCEVSVYAFTQIYVQPLQHACYQSTCIYVCMNLYMHTCLRAFIQRIACMQPDASIHVCLVHASHTLTKIRTWIQVCMHAYTLTCRHTNIHNNMNTYMHTYTYIPVYKHA